MTSVFGFAPSVLSTDELGYIRSQIKENAHLLDRENVISAYASAGLEVAFDPFDPTLTRRLIEALQTDTPYSHIRVGDGEISLLAYGSDPNTPNLDRFALERSIMNFQDRFRLSEAWATKLQTLMQAAIQASDSVGVVGMWRAREVENSEFLEYTLRNIEVDPRGISGHWRAIKHMLDLGRAGRLDGKLVCSAHSYFGIIKGVGDIITAATRTICITNRLDAVAGLRSRFPKNSIRQIELPSEFSPPEQMPNEPNFLYQVKSQIPDDLRGQLVLLGAGAWAEFYCTWIKERGGVAVDIGSGFDLLQGTVTRPIHRRYLEEQGLSVDSFLSPG